MVDEPLKLDYANPLEDQPVGSDAIIEHGECSVTITIPPRGLLSVAWLLLLPVGVMFLAVPLFASFEQHTRTSQRFVALLLLGLIVGVAAVITIEALVGSRKPNILSAKPRHLTHNGPSYFWTFKEFIDARGSHLRVSIGEPGIKFGRVALVSDLRILGRRGMPHALIRQRDKRELEWIKRQLGKALDQPVPGEVVD